MSALRNFSREIQKSLTGGVCETDKDFERAITLQSSLYDEDIRLKSDKAYRKRKFAEENARKNAEEDRKLMESFAN